MERKFTRLYSGPDGESHFQDVTVPLANDDHGGGKSQVMKATGVFFQEIGGDYHWGWHPAPRRQIVVTLEGEGEIEVSDGTVIKLKPGDVTLIEDITGRGHNSRSLSNQHRKIVVITLD